MDVKFYTRSTKQFLGLCDDNEAIAFATMAEVIRKFGVECPGSKIGTYYSFLTTGIDYNEDHYIIDEGVFCHLVEQFFNDQIDLFQPWAARAIAIYELIKGKQFQWWWDRPYDPGLPDDEQLSPLYDMEPTFWSGMLRPTEKSERRFGPEW